jgi:hypothetical protein
MRLIGSNGFVMVGPYFSSFTSPFPSIASAIKIAI